MSDPGSGAVTEAGEGTRPDANGAAGPQPEWFREAFGADYTDLYAHRDESDAARTFAFLDRALEVRPGMKLLDLCCGHGRHLAQLLRLPCRKIGLDLSGDLLDQAREVCCGDAAGNPRRCELVRGDMRHLPFAAASFDVVVNLFTSFGYFMRDEENRAVLGEVSRILRPGGRFVIDHISYPWLRAHPPGDTERELPGGAVVREHRWYDAGHSRINKRIEWTEEGRESRRWNESVRVYRRAEMENELRGAGLEVVNVSGDFDGHPFGEDSPRMIFLAEKAA